MKTGLFIKKVKSRGRGRQNNKTSPSEEEREGKTKNKTSPHKKHKEGNTEKQPSPHSPAEGGEDTTPKGVKYSPLRCT